MDDKSLLNRMITRSGLRYMVTHYSWRRGGGFGLTPQRCAV